MNVVCRNMEYVRCRRRGTSRQGRNAYVSPYKIRNGLGGPSFDSISLGGTKIAENLVSAAEGYASQFAQKQVGAALKKVLGEQNRVEQSWEMQKTAKANQIKNVQKKKTTAEIKIDYAKKQLENYEREIELKDEMYEHLSEKYTNRDLYTWLKKETGKVYKTLFQLAAKVARKAEKCYHFEIGDTDENPKTAKTFIKGSGVYWDGLHSGLLAGEKLLADLHAMEVAYLENDRIELEITRPVSLKEIVVGTKQVDGNDVDITILDQLRTSTNWSSDEDRNRSFYSTSFNLKEEVFFSDFRQPHYFGRIRDVKLQVVCDNNVRLTAELNMDNNILHTRNNGLIVNRIGVQTLATSTANSICGKYIFDFNRDKFAPGLPFSQMISSMNRIRRDAGMECATFCATATRSLSSMMFNTRNLRLLCKTSVTKSIDQVMFSCFGVTSGFLTRAGKRLRSGLRLLK